MTDAILPGSVGVTKSMADCLDTSQSAVSTESIKDDYHSSNKLKNVQNIPNGCINHKLCDEDSVVNQLSTVSLSNGNSGNPNTPTTTSEYVRHEEEKKDDLSCSSLSSINSTEENHESTGRKIVCSHESCLCSGNCLKVNSPPKVDSDIEYVVYESELQMPHIMGLITKDLSEPYSIYTYRYFIHNWPKLCFLAKSKTKYVGAIVCKLDVHKKMSRRGYIAMLAVDKEYRRKGMGSELVLRAIRAMVADDCDEVVLETEISNKAALRLYENLGFVRDKRLFRYYLNGVDALRLKLWLR